MAYTRRPIQLKTKERATLERLMSDRAFVQRIRRAAWAILLMDQGLTGVAISRRTGFSQMHVSWLRRCFWEKGIEGFPASHRPAHTASTCKPPLGSQARRIVLRSHEKARLQRLSKNPKTPSYIRHRALALILMNKGLQNTEISRQVGYSIQYVSKLRRLFAREGMKMTLNKMAWYKEKIASGCSPSPPEPPGQDAAVSKQCRAWPVQFRAPKVDREWWNIESSQQTDGKWLARMRDTTLQIGATRENGRSALQEHTGKGSTEREAVDDLMQAINSYLKERRPGWSASLV